MGKGTASRLWRSFGGGRHLRVSVDRAGARRSSFASHGSNQRVWRRTVAWSTVLAGSVAMGGVVAGEAAAAPDVCDPQTNALCQREITKLNGFTAWLAKKSAKGYIGEVGWPSYPQDNSTFDGARWNELGELWFRAADAAKLPVTGWAAGEWYQPGKNTNIYEHTDHSHPLKPLSVARKQAEVFETHYGLSGGVNSVGGEGIQNGFSNKKRGVYGTHYHYDSQKSFEYLASRGVRVIRLLFRWERVQPVLHQSIPTSLAGFKQLKSAIGRANAAGLKVIVEPHNFGAYHHSSGVKRIGLQSGPNTISWRAFRDLWRRLAPVLKNVPGLLGYGLMNEPHDLKSGSVNGTFRSEAQVWETASRSAVLAIRRVDKTHTIYVPAYAWGSVRSFAACHPKGPWIYDPANKLRYEAHQYFDHDESGNYTRTYAEEKADAMKPQGPPDCPAG